MNLIEVVVINWMRPRNVEKIIFALKKQSIACTITICDCHNHAGFSLNPEVIALADRVYSWKHNLGAFSRYVPLASFDHRFTFFIDDDMLPGTRCLEGFMNAANSLKNFGVLGQLGRILDEDDIYRPVDIERGEEVRQTDFIIRAYFIQTEFLYNVPRFRWHLNYFDESELEDDLLLCASLNFYENLPCYLLPYHRDPEFLVNKEELSTEYALSKRIDHRKRRIAFIKRLIGAGWKSMKKQTSYLPNDNFKNYAL